MVRSNHKYGAKKIRFLGHSFDSKAEYEFYLRLLADKQDGIIKEIVLQPEYELQPAFEKYGKRYRKMVYTPDFYVRYADGREEAIDIKGMTTTDAEMRRKLFIYRYDIPLRWIKKDKGEWRDI